MDVSTRDKREGRRGEGGNLVLSPRNGSKKGKRVVKGASRFSCRQRGRRREDRWLAASSRTKS